jgi:multiple sugar transport system permease protein
MRSMVPAAQAAHTTPTQGLWVRATRVARRGILAALLFALLLLFMIPLLWFLALALRPATTDFAVPPNLAFVPSLWAFLDTFVSPGENMHNLLASVIESGGAVLITTPLAILAAYGFTRYRFKGRRFTLLWLLTLLLTPPMGMILPNYIVMNALGLIGSYVVMMLMYQTFTLPLSIWLLRGFLHDIPREMEEAAAIDGAGRLRILWSVILPTSKPGILVTLMFAFVFSWNNTIFPLAMSNGNSQPLPISTLNYFATTGVTWNYIAATSIVTILPPAILFFLFRRYIVKGLTFGAVTG